MIVTFLLLCAVGTCDVPPPSIHSATVLWKTLLKGSVWSTPQWGHSDATGSVLLVGSYDSTVQAFRADTGALLWRVQSNNSVRANLVVDSQRETVLDATLSGGVTMRRIADGSVVWRHQRPSHTWLFSPVLVTGGAMYVFPSRNDDMFALYAVNGSEAPGICQVTGTSGVWNSPVVVASVDSFLVYFDITASAIMQALEVSNDWHSAKKRWVHDFVPTARHWKQKQHAWIFGSPAVCPTGQRDESVVIAGSNDRTVRAATALSGEEVWRVGVSGKVSSSPLCSGPESASQTPLVFVLTESGAVVALKTTDGSEAWKVSIGDNVPSSIDPARMDHVIVVGSQHGKLCGLHTDSGSKLFELQLPGCDIRSAPGLVKRGRDLHIAVGCTSGEVFAVRVSELFEASTVVGSQGRHQGTQGESQPILETFRTTPYVNDSDAVPGAVPAASGGTTIALAAGALMVCIICIRVLRRSSAPKAKC